MCGCSPRPTPTCTRNARKAVSVQDLLFRLNTVEIHLPPLRERREDVPLLAGHFLVALEQRYRRLLSGFAPRALEMMMQYAWPGTVVSWTIASNVRC